MYIMCVLCLCVTVSQCVRMCMLLYCMSVREWYMYVRMCGWVNWSDVCY